MKDFQKKINLYKKKLIKSNFLFIPIFLVFILSILVAFDIYQKGKYLWIATNSYNINYKVKDYPFLKKNYSPFITARSALIVDKDSKVIIFEQNKNFRFSPASTTKIMTAIVGLEHYNLTDVLEIKETTLEGSVLGLVQGQKMTFENLMYAMMLPSANDAALAIAQNYPGGERKFVDQMNKKAEALNLKNTHFDDPAGLSDINGYTTAVELFQIASYALDNKVFAKIVSAPRKSIADVSGYPYALFSKNKLLGVEGVNGIKTGFTEEAGDVLVTSKNSDGHTIIIVVLKSQDRFADTYELLQLVNSENLTYLSIHP